MEALSLFEQLVTKTPYTVESTLTDLLQHAPLAIQNAFLKQDANALKIFIANKKYADRTTISDCL